MSDTAEDIRQVVDGVFVVVAAAAITAATADATAATAASQAPSLWEAHGCVHTCGSTMSTPWTRPSCGKACH